MRKLNSRSILGRLAMIALAPLSLVMMASLTLLACGGSGGGGGGGTGGPSGPFTSNDPLFTTLWHLLNTGQGGGTAAQDVNVTPAWTAGFTGNGVRLCVIDDAIEALHEDLAPNYVVGAGLNLAGGTDTAPVLPADNHGTGVAGVAAARGGNAIGTTGAAPFVSLVGVKPLPQTAGETTTALTHNAAVTGIYNMSFGPADDGLHHATDANTIATIDQGLATGRGGRGAIYVRASGNGGALPDHANLDEENGLPGVIAVSAVNAAGVKSDFSELAACVLVGAPGGGSAPLPGIISTDRTGAPGEDATNYTTAPTALTGTSFSAPLVSGVIALILQANPNLTWRDVRRVLAFTARKNDPLDPDWVNNGAGRPVNHKYGFGTPDAGAAVVAAPGFASVGGTLTTFNSAADATVVPIPDNNAVGITRTIVVAGSTVTNIDVVHALVQITHPSLRNLEITLTSPAGTVSRLLVPDPAIATASPGLLTLATARLLGETAVNGTWTLVVKDLVAGTTGDLASWSLRIMGSN